MEKAAWSAYISVCRGAEAAVYRRRKSRKNQQGIFLLRYIEGNIAGGDAMKTLTK